MNDPKRSQYNHAKTPYRVRNWPEYEAGLCRRGDVTIWFSEDAIKSWTAPANGKPGGQLVYANVAIETALTLRMVFHLPLRQTEGFLGSRAAFRRCSIRSKALLHQPEPTAPTTQRVSTSRSGPAAKDEP